MPFSPFSFAKRVIQDDQMMNDLRGYELELYDVSSILRSSANIGEQ